MTAVKIDFRPTFSSGGKEGGIRMGTRRLQEYVTSARHTDRSSAADDTPADHAANNTTNHFFVFMEHVIAHLKALGKERTPETYAATLRSFRRFRRGRDLTFDEVDSDQMLAYESYLRSNGVRPNSTSFYMRILRAHHTHLPRLAGHHGHRQSKQQNSEIAHVVSHPTTVRAENFCRELARLLQRS